MRIKEPIENNSDSVVAATQEKKAVPPPAWKPGVVWDGAEGEITSRPSDERVPHWDDILKCWGYDPDEYEIVEPVKVSTWDAQTAEGTQQLWSYKAGLRVRTNARTIPYDDLVKEIKRHRPFNPKTPEGGLTFFVALADWQIGKADGYGLDGTIDGIITMIDTVERRIRDLRLLGRDLGTLVVAGLGDMIENCDGNYPGQAFTTQANRREQLRIARRLLRDAIARWSKLFHVVIVTAVPGNHGENRREGKMFTEYGDNDDVALFEVLADIFAENPEAYGHIKFLIPKNEVTVTLDCSGIIVALNHGHFASGGTSPQLKQKKWWEDQAFGEQPAGDAKILITGHYHHSSHNQYGKKSHFQCPSMDGGSLWFQHLKGTESPPGTLTLVVGEGAGLGGWSDLQIC